MATCRALPIAQRRRITFEYVMLAGVNDAPADAARLVQLLHGIRAKVNLIPFNPFPGSGFAPPAPAVVREFQQRLLARRRTPPCAPRAAATSRPPAASWRRRAVWR